MSNIVLFLICLCSGLLVSRRRLLPAEVPIVLDRSIAFDALPGLVLLQSHDIRLRAVLVPSAARPSPTVAGRHCPPEAV